ncbi:MAG: hypothetical protein O4805_07300 [Trichodesmium sp. St16_bin2-tuft]|nr:hypothetical protein [Trichodesmium sp. St16_bin2-tuft]
MTKSSLKLGKNGTYSPFQIYQLHRHNQNLVGTFRGTSLLWSTKIKTPV